MTLRAKWQNFLVGVLCKLLRGSSVLLGVTLVNCRIEVRDRRVFIVPGCAEAAIIMVPGAEFRAHFQDVEIKNER